MEESHKKLNLGLSEIKQILIFMMFTKDSLYLNIFLFTHKRI